MTIFEFEEKRSVGVRKSKSNANKHIMKLFKPSLRSLFESIQSSMKFTNLVKMRIVDKTRRLFHVYDFFKKAMEKSIIKIKLAHGPFVRDSQKKNYMNYYRCKQNRK